MSAAASGATVIDLSTGQTVFARNAALPLLPASNEKLAITYAALTALGPAFRIETDVLGEGRQDGTIWRGNVVLKGYGDPALTSAELASLARQVRASGVTQIAGRHRRRRDVVRRAENVARLEGRRSTSTNRRRSRR